MPPNEKARRAAQRRKMQRQLERRRQRALRRRRINLIISVVGVLIVVGGVITLIVATSGSDSSNDAASNPSTSAPAASSPAPSSSSASMAPYPCTWTKSGSAAKQASVPSTKTPPRKGTATVQVATNRGDLTFALNRAKAPCAVASFVSLTQQKYFNSTPCHRLTTSGIYVLQCGDPSGTGSGGPGYSFADELSGKEKYGTGVLAMANSGPNTNGSQFFIVYKDSQLPPSYTVFGAVTKGLDVVTNVAAKGVTGGGQDGKPAQSVTLQKLTVAK